MRFDWRRVFWSKLKWRFYMFRFNEFSIRYKMHIFPYIDFRWTNPNFYISISEQPRDEFTASLWMDKFMEQACLNHRSSRKLFGGHLLRVYTVHCKRKKELITRLNLNDILILISLQLDGFSLPYFKLWLLNLTEIYFFK